MRPLREQIKDLRSDFAAMADLVRRSRRKVWVEVDVHLGSCCAVRHRATELLHDSQFAVLCKRAGILLSQVMGDRAASVELSLFNSDDWMRQWLRDGGVLRCWSAYGASPDELWLSFVFLSSAQDWFSEDQIPGCDWMKSYRCDDGLRASVLGCDVLLLQLDSVEEGERRVSAKIFVTLAQAAAMVQRSKRTLEKYKDEMPVPDVKGGAGKPHEWDWNRLRPWLIEKFGRNLPVDFPSFTRPR